MLTVPLIKTSDFVINIAHVSSLKTALSFSADCFIKVGNVLIMYRHKHMTVQVFVWVFVRLFYPKAADEPPPK